MSHASTHQQDSDDCRRRCRAAGGGSLCHCPAWRRLFSYGDQGCAHFHFVGRGIQAYRPGTVTPSGAARVATVLVLSLPLAACSSTTCNTIPTGNTGFTTTCPDDFWTGKLLNIFLAVITLATLGVAWWQLRVQRDTAGGRGIVLGAGRTGWVTILRGKRFDQYLVRVILAGPGAWYELAVDLEKGGRPIELPNQPRPPYEPQKRPELPKRMTNESDEIRWYVDLPPQDAEGV